MPRPEDSGSGESWFEPRRGTSKALHYFRGAEPSSVFARCYRFSATTACPIFCSNRICDSSEHCKSALVNQEKPPSRALRPVSVPAYGTKEFGQLDSDRVSLSPEPGIRGTSKREIVTIGPDRARRVTY